MQLPIYSALIVPMIHDERLISNKIAIFKALIQCDPNSIEHKDSSGDSVFHLMATNQAFYPLMSELLRKDNQGAFYCNNHTQYPIHIAILNHQEEITQLLLFTDKKIATLSDAKRRVALHYAARYGTENIVRDCCQATTDINIRDNEEKTPLILAAETGNLIAVQILIKNNANASLVDIYGRSILHAAISSMNKELVEWILEHTSVDVNLPDVEGTPPFQFCLLYPNEAIAKLLTAKGARGNPLTHGH